MNGVNSSSGGSGMVKNKGGKSVKESALSSSIKKKQVLGKLDLYLASEEEEREDRRENDQSGKSLPKKRERNEEEEGHIDSNELVDEIEEYLDDEESLAIGRHSTGSTGSDSGGGGGGAAVRNILMKTTPPNKRSKREFVTIDVLQTNALEGRGNIVQPRINISVKNSRLACLSAYVIQSRRGNAGIKKSKIYFDLVVCNVEEDIETIKRMGSKSNWCVPNENAMVIPFECPNPPNLKNSRFNVMLKTDAGYVAGVPVFNGTRVQLSMWLQDGTKKGIPSVIKEFQKVSFFGVSASFDKYETVKAGLDNGTMIRNDAMNTGVIGVPVDPSKYGITAGPYVEALSMKPENETDEEREAALKTVIELGAFDFPESIDDIHSIDKYTVYILTTRLYGSSYTIRNIDWTKHRLVSPTGARRRIYSTGDSNEKTGRFPQVISL